MMGLGAGGGHSLSLDGVRASEVLPRKIFWNFMCKTVHFGEYLCDNWSTEWVHFALLNTDVEAFLNRLLDKTATNVSREIVT